MSDRAKQKDANRLYDRLISGENEFNSELILLAKRARRPYDNDASRQMWSTYLTVMTRFGQLLFGSDVYWNPHSDQIEPVLDLLLREGYAARICLLVQGADDLIRLSGTSGRGHYSHRLQDIAHRYRGLIAGYMDAGVLTSDQRGIKWDFIDYSNLLFGEAYDIVEALASTPDANEAIRNEKARREATRIAASDLFFDMIEEVEHPVRYRIKKAFRKLFSRRDR